MAKKLLMGNEAIALGAMRAGVSVVTGYPGTPSSEVLETVAKHNDGRIYVEWSVNEKSALEVAAGAAYAGARVMVTMKQVGLNVASDPLMNLNYIGVLGGMVVVAADDPGPISSQNEQDTRSFSKFAKLALFDPSTPEEAYLMIADAFACSEKYGKPVLFRPTTRVCHSCASVEILENLPVNKPAGFKKDPKWVIFPRLAYANKFKLEENLVAMREEFSKYERNILTGEGKKGIATGGVSYAYTQEALLGNREQGAGSKEQLNYKLLKISTLPFPDKLAVEFLKELDEVLVIEELDPVIENELLRVCGLYNLNVKILGKQTGHIQIAGENTADSVAKAVATFLGLTLPEPVKREGQAPALPVRPPVLCAGCPHRASFFAVKEATKNIKAVYTGDIGCYTLGNAQPLDMVDTCLCMGAGITVAQGLKRVEDLAAGMPLVTNDGVFLEKKPQVENRQGSRFSTHFAFIGDSTFFHTGIPGVINAVYNQTDIIVVVLDNSTTAMTGNQPHPGMGVTMMNTHPDKISIEKIVTAIGVSAVVKVNPLDQKAAKEAIRSVIEKKGVRVILFEAPCIAVSKNPDKAAVDTAKCTGCKLCMQKYGCPAINLEDGKAKINPTLCAGCGVCATLCGPGAIKMTAGTK
jgi:indolepyruvate ferredoxin oxidoreductase alpha subunit